MDRLPGIVPEVIDTEVLVVSILLHDMGLANTSIVLDDTRFEVDGVDIALIVLHTTPSIMVHKRPQGGAGGRGHHRRLLRHPTCRQGPPPSPVCFWGWAGTSRLRARPAAGLQGHVSWSGAAPSAGRRRWRGTMGWANSASRFGSPATAPGREVFAAELWVWRHGLAALMMGLESLKSQDGMAAGGAWDKSRARFGLAYGIVDGYT
ncbi:hypothetical protein GGTG_10594 [Gaeumannomyces tritici R3-111a-1]|uniref:Uncharacterized protein n=1 Tax=Gaeumannomyces tritici (strain R3-111a-1) TaxID=644352 RepID=J3PAR9_GAET3|nr:hypothetical protein GGTG_10594 [Gaeumannomyces tritici R3-111a-1]EJT71335.1 hypothetical protein GGTG_10594 [Gaeumannomyces tritici R3-111a-1]